jgi:3-dehydroquinate synthase
MIGAFYQPRCVVADTAVVETLAQRDYRAGLAEVVKYGVVRDAAFFDWLEQHTPELIRRDPDSLATAIRRSCEIKAEVVAADEREAGLRAILNFGHTFGHAIETLTGYQRLLHGEAVAIGMVMAADLSVRQGLLSGAEAPVAPPALPSQDMLAAMGMDKKVLDGRLRLVLAEALGNVLVTETVDSAALRQTLSAGDRLCDV